MCKMPQSFERPGSRLSFGFTIGSVCLETITKKKKQAHLNLNIAGWYKHKASIPTVRWFLARSISFIICVRCCLLFSTIKQAKAWHKKFPFSKSKTYRSKYSNRMKRRDHQWPFYSALFQQHIRPGILLITQRMSNVCWL